MKDILLKTRTVPHKRLLYIYALAKAKRICDGGGGGAEDKNTNIMDDPKMMVMKNSLVFTIIIFLFIFNKARGGCGRYQPKLRKIGLEITAEWKEINEESQERKIVVSAERVLEIFKNMSDDDCRIIGIDPNYSRPDSMIITVLPVPPLPVRPAVVMHGSARNQVLL